MRNSSVPSINCIGTLPRRALLRLGVAGLGSLTLPALLRLEQLTATEKSRPSGKSLIVLWLWGGPSHMEMFGLKPDAPLELRMGQAVGSTTEKGDEPFERPLTPNDLLATLYSYMGVPLTTHFLDRFGRPIAILPHGKPIEELT